MKIRTIREFRKLTQEYLAEQIGTCRKTYNRIEAGKAPLTIARLQKISVVLQVTEEELKLFSLDTLFKATNT